VTNFKALTGNMYRGLRKSMKSVNEHSGCPSQEFKSGTREYEASADL
jgi:hypothetical protein